MIFSDELDEDVILYLKDICIKHGSESIIKYLEEKNIESLDMERFYEKSFVIKFYQFNYFIINRMILNL